ncbi:4Fe-4S dicluster domain-containing protein [uncultured Bacteroides sp.]|uniref:4Fe-4S dicluster domain-containing protein n=1 Tax=uncultured Bacteroides sp. TaxID=162156 RepID=UPI002AA8B87B|nr:4Fe-4S dicluster domain-containing protein [uncultured Bacteroides sp.]
MLKKIRITISALFFALITFYFLDIANILPPNFHWLAEIQFIPALLSLSILVLIALIVSTLIFGRIYCSVICPMGIFQDVIRRFSKPFYKKKRKYAYSKAKTLLRWSVLIITIAAFFCGLSFIIGLLDPYSAYGRMTTNIFKPIYMAGNNLLENIFSRYENYTFYKVDIAIRSIISFVIGIVTFLVISVLAWKHGRTWCNTICPVGTVLGLLSKLSFFKVRIDLNKCTNCGLCATKCKASCIDVTTHAIDYSRCVDCFNCLDVCRQKAINYKPSVAVTNQGANASKRRFLMAGLTTAVAAPQAMLYGQSVTSLLSNKKAYKKENPLTPPGSINREHFQEHCTSCHLCVSKCPSHVLKPAFMEYGLEGIMQPTVDFAKGFCNFDCTLCGDICPTQAIKPLTLQQKHTTQMGYVVFIKENCIVYTDNTSCGACSEHCPTQAIAMVTYKNGLTIPQVNKEICVGCGGCEYVCPARPYKAVHIEGNPIQIAAKPFKEVKKKKIEIDNFGF